ncbi:MAG TPA: hypothetical protein VF781_13985 [Solirubrobacteraceae bacterium]
MSITSTPLSGPVLNRRPAPLASAGLLAIAVVHLTDGSVSLSGTAYVGVLQLALVAFSLPMAIMLLVRPLRVLWQLAGGVTLLALLCFLASRTIGLPGSTDDIGNWSQALGLVNLVVELLVLAVVAGGLQPGRKRG